MGSLCRASQHPACNGARLFLPRCRFIMESLNLCFVPEVPESSKGWLVPKGQQARRKAHKHCHQGRGLNSPDPSHTTPVREEGILGVSAIMSQESSSSDIQKWLLCNLKSEKLIDLIDGNIKPLANPK